VSLLELGRERVLHQRPDDLAAGADPLAGLDHPVIQHLGQHDPAVEDPRRFW